MKQKIYDVHQLWIWFVTNKKWFVLSLLLCLCIGAAYIYFVRPVYKVSGKLMVVDKKKDVSSINLNIQNQLPFGLGNSLGGSSSVENEKEVLKSRLVACDVVKDLGLYKEYRVRKLFKSNLVYKTQPVNVSLDEKDVEILDKNYPMLYYRINLTIIKNDEGYQVEGSYKENKKKTDLPDQSFKSLPAVVKTPIGNLTLTANKELTAKQQKQYDKGYQLEVTIETPMNTAVSFAKRMQVNSPTKKTTSVAVIELRDENILRGIDYINSLAAHYNNRYNEDRRKEATKNDEFVSDRLAKIDAELSLSDADFEKFKRQFQVTDPKVDAEEVMTKKGGYEGQLVNIGTQLMLLDYLSEYVNDSANRFELIPVNVGVYTGDALSMISNHNSLVSERNLALKSSSEQAPQVKRLTQLIEELHPVIKTALERDRQSLILRRSVAEKEYYRYQGRIKDVPEQERVLTEVSRLRNIRQAVYLTLLQKREENAMELANTTEKGKLIDATLYKGKVKPRIIIVLALALFMGFILPYIVLFLRRWLRGTVGSYDDLLSETIIPVVGDINSIKSEKMEESFLTLRTHLLHKMKDKKTVLMTSYGCSEGKTFLAIRLAESFARIGKKVLLCDLNFRNPAVEKELGLTGIRGLSDLLSAQQSLVSRNYHDYVIPVPVKGFDAVVAGQSNSFHPADLLGHQDMRQFLQQLKETYDVVIYDTAAVGEYADTLELADLADITCFVCVSGKTPRIVFDKLMNQSDWGILPCPCIILNSK